MKHKYRILSALLSLFVAIGVLGLSSAAEATAPVTTWDALQTAIEQASGETTIHIQGTLEKDAQDTVITVPKDVHITLVGDKTDDLAATIVRPSQSSVGEFVVPDGAGLTLQGDITIAGNAQGSTSNDLTCANFINVEKGGKLHIEGAITASTQNSDYRKTPLGLIYCEGAVSLSNGGAVSGWLNPLSTGNFDGESAALVIKGKDASLTMDGGEIFNNKATATSKLASSAAVQIRDGATFTMNGGSIHDNNVGQQGCGGGVMVTGAGSTFTMNGGDIRANQGRYGAGVYIEGQAADKNAGTEMVPATFTMRSGTFSENALNNSSGSQGGGLYAENSTVTITKATDAALAPTFDGNKTSFMGGMNKPFTSDGGAIYCANSTLTINEAIIINTKADSTNGHGGSVHLDNTKANLTNTTLSKNQCGTNNMAFAGALYITGPSEITMDHMTITDNTAAPVSEYTNGGAGAMLISGDANKSAKVTITNSTISNNMTGGANAGAIYAEGATLSIADSNINSNTAKTPDGQNISSWFRYNGGALYLAGSTVELERVTLNDNQAVGGFGGAIMAENIVERNGNVIPSKVTLSDCTLKNNKAEKVEAITTGGMGGAIYVDSGTLHSKGHTTVENNSAFAGGGILVGEEAVLDIQDQTIIQGNSAAEGGNGDGICVMSDATPDAAATKIGTLNLQDEARIAPDNDVTLFPGTVITIAAPYQGASTTHPIHITSYEEAIENLENSTQGTPLVHFSDAAGGAAKAQEADQGKHFVASQYMPNPQGPNAGKLLLIGQSKVQDNGHILTYLGASQGVTVTFDANGGAWADGSTTQSQRAAASGTLTLPQHPTKDDKVFNGWNTQADGTGTTYAPDKPIPAPQTDTTYYAQWKDKDSGSGGGGGTVTDYVTLHYDSNGGTQYKSERYTKNTTVQLDKTPTRDGYTFTGWYADKDLTQKISEIKMTATKTVYAGWQSDKVPEMLNGKDHFAYIVGYTDGTVKPLNKISRAETATIFFRLLNEDVRNEHLSDTCTFDDVIKNQWYNIPICTMTDLGILKGRSENTFAPNEAITRAEFAVICARFDTGVIEEDVNFTDISGHWAEKDIKRAAALGWVEGHPDGSFHPNDYITRAEAAAMINRVLCRQPENEDDLLEGMIEWPDNPSNVWYYLTMQEATNSHDYIRKDGGYEKWTALTNATK